MVGGIRIAIQIAEVEGSFGEYRHDERKIVIAPATLRKRQDLVSTLRHEILHAALQISGVGFSEKYDEESIVRCFDGIFWPAWERMRKKLETA